MARTWVQHFRHALDWIRAFFHTHAAAPITRTFHLRAHLNLGVKICITTDASPWGIGGFITADGIVVGYFMDAISSQDERVLGQRRGTHEGQQCFEALASLVALRLWVKLWATGRCILAVRSDNMTTCALVRDLKGKSTGLNLIASELALDIADATHEPDVVQHTPGLQNKIADVLSRSHEPGVDWELPAILKNTTVHATPTD